MSLVGERWVGLLGWGVSGGVRVYLVYLVMYLVIPLTQAPTDERSAWGAFTGLQPGEAEAKK